MIGQSSHHGRGLMYAASGLCKCHVRAAVVVVHGVKCDGVPMVLDLLREGVGQSRKPTHSHPHCKVLALDVASGDVVAVGPPHDRPLDRAQAYGRAVPRLTLWRRAVNLVQHCVVNAIPPESILNGGEIGAVSVSRELNTIGEATREVADEAAGVFLPAPSDMEARDELRVGTDRCPRPSIAQVNLSAKRSVNMPLFHSDETPNLVTLNPFARKVYEMFLLVGETRFANFFKKFDDRVLGRTRNANRGADGVSVNKRGKDTHPLLYTQFIHAPNMLRRLSIIKGQYWGEL